jgi:homoserine dehydrogenase
MGLGVVGSGVVRALADKADVLARQVGRSIEVKRALVRDGSAPRTGIPAGIALTTHPEEVVEDPGIDLVVEVMGGEQPALEYVTRSLKAKKHVVTANKELMAKHGPELLRKAAESGVMLRFEASVGGGIPIIGPLLDDLAANEISAVNAVINGTTNYMLTRMAADGLDYATVLDQARTMGYAEPDPAADVDGTDAAYKLAVLGSLAFHTTVRDTDVYREGIQRLAPADFRYAAELGYVIKLLATARRTDGKLQLRVHPAFLPAAHPLAKVDGVYNAVELEGDLVDWAMFQGPGAGARPTASAVLADVVAIAHAIGHGASARVIPMIDQGLVIEPIDELRTKYYLRLRAHDRPGVMAQITKVLGDLDVSLASVIQKEVPEAGQVAEVVVTTHVALESAVQEAVRRLAALDTVNEVANLVRVEERAN